MEIPETTKDAAQDGDPRAVLPTHTITTTTRASQPATSGSISNTDDGEYKCRDGSSPEVHYKVIYGVVGAAYSVICIQVANLLRLFRIPQMSFFSTSPELSNKQRFEHFSRTIPSDHYQVKAMVEIMKKLGWSYISILYEESNYGIKDFTQMPLLRPQTIIPIFRLLKPHRTSPKITHNTIIPSLKSPIHHKTSFQGQHHGLHLQNGCQFDL
ncbi:metabotropic glutamate receptor 3-like [Scylla paramamosain]|uniref:metabotropic glutamate receptor 3-like n=1 Tax=Scylla paramamosain TaxID=85552 RepID=UPI003083233C